MANSASNGSKKSEIIGNTCRYNVGQYSFINVTAISSENKNLYLRMHFNKKTNQYKRLEFKDKLYRILFCNYIHRNK